MNIYAKKAVLAVILFFVIFGLGAATTLSGAHLVLLEINPVFFIFACLFFIVSVISWLFSWSYLIKKRANIRFVKTLGIGVASFYGSLTPVQIGAEALRSINLKKIYGISYNESISASMVAKGAKFFVIGFFATIFLLLYLAGSAFDIGLFTVYASGFLVIAFASILFLLPLNRDFGGKLVVSFFRGLSNLKKPSIGFLSRLADFFESYSDYLSKTSLFSLGVVLSLCIISWFFEVLALYFAFASLSVFLPIQAVLLFATLVAVLERNPFLPRGIGLVELVGYYFLAVPSLAGGAILTSSLIVASLVVYGFVRLVIPTLISIIVSYPLLRLLESQESRKGN